MISSEQCYTSRSLCRCCVRSRPPFPCGPLQVQGLSISTFFDDPYAAHHDRFLQRIRETALTGVLELSDLGRSVVMKTQGEETIPVCLAHPCMSSSAFRKLIHQPLVFTRSPWASSALLSCFFGGSRAVQDPRHEEPATKMWKN